MISAFANVGLLDSTRAQGGQRLNGNAVMQPSRCAVNATVHERV